MNREAALTELLPLIRRRAKRMYRRCDITPVDDLVQIACVEVLKALPRYDGTGKLTTWICPRIDGAMLDYMRAHGRFLSGGGRTGRVERMIPLDRRYADSGREVGFVDRSEANAARQRDGYESLADLLRGLTDFERLICILRFVDDMPQSQIGKLLGVHETFISQKLKAIYDQLREVLSDRHMRKSA